MFTFSILTAPQRKISHALTGLLRKTEFNNMARIPPAHRYNEYFQKIRKQNDSSSYGAFLSKKSECLSLGKYLFSVSRYGKSSLSNDFADRLYLFINIMKS